LGGHEPAGSVKRFLAIAAAENIPHRDRDGLQFIKFQAWTPSAAVIDRYPSRSGSRYAPYSGGR
jgi:hypothetical protein